jgi:hypothetical protein
MTQQKKQHQQHNLTESLRPNDLANLVNEVFTVDQYKSKMGEDSDIVVLGFKVKEKNPATDLVEFIERGYNYVLDADMSTGEEHDGQYQVFVELERNQQLPENLKHLLAGVAKLTGTKEWRFRYQQAPSSVEFNEQSVMEHIPTTPEDYNMKINEIKTTDVQQFFDQGTVEVALESDNTIKFSKTYSGDVDAKFIAIGEYDDVKQTLPGALSLDESSQSQVTFLTKYLGNYDINKIGNKFLIRNGAKAVVIEKGKW